MSERSHLDKMTLNVEFFLVCSGGGVFSWFASGTRRCASVDLVMEERGEALTFLETTEA